MQVTGTIIKIGATETVGTKGFQKRQLVIEVKGNDPKFTDKVPFELHKDRVDLVDAYAEGQEVEVDFNIKGSEWNGKYYVNLVAWKVQPVKGGEKRQMAPAIVGNEADDFIF
jgi:hypothetical protein